MANHRCKFLSPQKNIFLSRLLTELSLSSFSFSLFFLSANATIVMILMSLLMQSFTIFLMYSGDKKAMKRELFYVLTFVKGKSTLSLTSSLFSIIVLTIHSFHPTLSRGTSSIASFEGFRYSRLLERGSNGDGLL
jgi:site-specific recombinase